MKRDKESFIEFHLDKPVVTVTNTTANVTVSITIS
jgi:hypothetical protein